MVVTIKVVKGVYHNNHATMEEGRYYMCFVTNHLLYMHRIKNHEHRVVDTLMVSLLPYVESTAGLVYVDRKAITTWYGNSELACPWFAGREVKSVLMIPEVY